MKTRGSKMLTVGLSQKVQQLLLFSGLVSPLVSHKPDTRPQVARSIHLGLGVNFRNVYTTPA